MIFTETKLKGVFIIDIEPISDRRGFFARAFCAKEFQLRGLNSAVSQCNLSYNEKQGTLRGLHYQIDPATETKIVRCIRGAIYDVIVDMRPESPTYLQHISVELAADNRRALYVPGMFAHGYQTLTDNAEVFYQVSEFYSPECERGLRYDDPILGIEWPLGVREISEKDAAYSFLKAKN